MAHRGYHVYAIQLENVGSARSTPRRMFGDVALIVFLLVQALDGALTYVGVVTFGLAAEGNPLIAWLMNALGHGAGVAAAKLVAGLFGVLLHVSGVHKAVAVLAGFYLVVAVAPWVAFLFLWS